MNFIPKRLEMIDRSVNVEKLHKREKKKKKYSSIIM